MGVPQRLRILVSWSMWSVPGKRVLPVSISAMMQPTLHRSTVYIGRDK